MPSGTGNFFWNLPQRYSMPDAPATYWDPLRRREVAATPEERVRQWFIGILKDRCSVPMHMMMSEVQMKFGSKTWRADILVYGKDGSPIAVVECKRPDVAIDGTVAEQALRYNSVLKVRFIFLTNGKNTYIYKSEGAAFKPMDRLPLWEEMKG